jgi:hypothetical protein
LLALLPLEIYAMKPVCPFAALRVRPIAPRLAAVGLLLAALPAQAWVLNIAPGPRQVYLAIGNATASGNNATVNLVTVDVPANALGNSVAQPMTSNSTQANSPLDGFAVCQPALGQVYIGGFLRRPAGGVGNAVLQVSTPANLVSAADTIPFSQISWTSTALGNATADIPAGSFTGAAQFLRNITPNTFVENCHTFNYANAAVRAAGAYTGRATYTLVAP